MKENPQPKRIGNYHVLEQIGRGGMGEIYLTHDPICERSVALKKIRPELMRFSSIKRRFLREAKIAAALQHPSIIPIYSIHSEKDEIYYTMPYIEGSTLKSMIRETREREKGGESPHPIGVSIPSLVRIFLQVCQAVAYTHSRGILHRDVKPENIMVGTFGEVMILDWGIANRIGQPEKEETLQDFLIEEEQELTRPGKVVGTVSFMAPERALGQEANISTDIYALGVMLYQLLTLSLPFTRPSLKEFRAQMEHERLIDPQELAPNRDIPPQLSDIVKKCLHFQPEERFQSVDELILEIEHFIEGYPEWIPSTALSINRSRDWEFQENIVLAKHIALTRLTQDVEWVMLMVSKEEFSGNIRMQTEITLSKEAQGVGFLLNVPKASERTSLEDGYCLWLGSQKSPACTLFRSNMQVLEIPSVFLSPEKKHHIAIERVENHFRLYIDGQLKLHYVSHLPLLGAHVGFLYRDAHFKMEDLNISLGSQNAMVNCLAVPDAFFKHGDFPMALAEYDRIAKSFRGRAEGREARFRKGLTYLEMAKDQPENLEKARVEFEELRHTPSAPLEYLGKALIYRFENDLEEEVKSFDIALRKFPKHPLLPILEEHLLTRLHKTSTKDRKGAYHFTLLILMHLPHLLKHHGVKDLITSLTNYWEKLPFMEQSHDPQNIATLLAFFLAKPAALYEILQSLTQDQTLFIDNLHAAFRALGYTEFHHPIPKVIAPKDLPLLNFQLTREKAGKLRSILPQHTPEEAIASYYDAISTWAAIYDNHFEEAKRHLQHHAHLAEQASHPFFFLKGCLILKEEGPEKALEHFKKTPTLPYPTSASLLSHYLQGRIDLSTWPEEAFLWERVQLYRQLALYAHCRGDASESLRFEELAFKELSDSRIPLHFQH